MNRFAHAAAPPGLRAREELVAPRLDALASLDDAGFRTLFAGSPVRRIGRGRFVRNVLNAAGNSADSSLRATAQRLCEDPDPVVADSARWAAARLA